MLNQLGNNNNTIINNLNKTSYEKDLLANPNIKNEIENKTVVGIEKKDIDKLKEKEEENECKTCAERKYQDDSTDGGVSFQSAQKISQSQVASTVMGHEREHFRREMTEAKNEGKEVVENRIELHKAICSECGKVYVSGGETTTTTKEKSEFSKKALEKNETAGINFDSKI